MEPENQLPELHPYSTLPPALAGLRKSFGVGYWSVENNNTKYKLPDRALGDPAFELIAYSTSGLQVSFVSSDPSIATIVGNLFI